MLSFGAEHRAATGLEAGDPVTLDLVRDEAERTVDLDDDFAAALAVKRSRRCSSTGCPTPRSDGSASVSPGPRSRRPGPGTTRSTSGCSPSASSLKRDNVEGDSSSPARGTTLPMACANQG